MTDNEIIKALECCSKVKGDRHLPVCRDCPLYGTRCATDLPKNALDLVNCQKAEIERYEKENNAEFNKWEILAERTKKFYGDLYEEAKGVVRAEAIKKFAEKAKAKAHIPKPYGMTAVVDVYDIDNLVKEMIGEDNA